MRLLLLAVMVSLLVLRSAAAAPPMLIADLSHTPRYPSGEPSSVGWTAGSAVPSDFAILLTNTSLSSDVFLTNGTADGTRLIRGLPQERYGLTAARNRAGRVVLTVTRKGGILSVFAMDTDSARALPIIDLTVTNVVAVGDRFIFATVDDAHGRELWVTDGDPHSPAAHLLVDHIPGPSGSVSQIVASDGERAFFVVAAETGAPTVLWVTDGTAEGTRPIGPVHPTRPTANIDRGVPLGPGFFYLVREPDSSSLRAYYTDAVSPAAAALTLADGRSFTSDIYLVPTGNRVLFAGTDTTRRLFMSDGTSAGTVDLVTTAAPVRYGYAVVPDPGAPLGWRAFYPGSPSSSHAEPAVSDGTPEGSRLIADLNPGLGSLPHTFTALGNIVYFETSTSNLGGYYYQGAFFATDGTASGTINLTDDLPGTPGSAAPVAVVNGQLLVRGTSPERTGLWSFDPALRRYDFIADLFPGIAESRPRLIASDENHALLSALTLPPGMSAEASSLVVSDGDPGGTRVLTSATQPVLAEVRGCPGGIATFDGRFLVYANTAATGDEPFLVEPASGSVSILSDLNPGVNGSMSQYSCNYSFSSVRLGARALVPTAFFGFPPAGSGFPSFSLWSLGDSLGEADRLAVFRSVFGDQQELFQFSILGGRAFFLAPPPDSGSTYTELWATDGTVAGTVRISRLIDLQITSARNLVRHGSRLHFIGDGTNLGRPRLFTSDGSSGGASLVSLGPTFDAMSVSLITATARGLVVSTTSPSRSRIVWITDGSVQGTIQLTPERVEYIADSRVVDAGSRFFFIRSTDDLGIELWVSDGTPAGTHPAADIAPGKASSFPSALLALGDGRVLFAAETADYGTELWQSDGAAYGTRLVADLNPGPASISALPLGIVGNQVLLALDDGTATGEELWRWTVTPPCRCDVDNSGRAEIQDILAFLERYFAGDGDINADGRNSVQDILDFLQCWFAGCE